MTTGITKDVLNLRALPSATSPILRVLPAGLRLRVVEVLGDWLKVEALGAGGFVARLFVDLLPDERVTPSPSPAPTPAPVLSKRRLLPNMESINIRSEPVIRMAPDNRIEIVLAGGVLIPLEADGDLDRKVGTPQADALWVRVRTPGGQEGFVAAWVVRFAPEGDGGSLPAPDGDDPYAFVNVIPNMPALPAGYAAFWAERSRLGLPDPFDVFPSKLPADKLLRTPVNGFGPNTFAFKNWQSYYKNVGGMHNGLDHIIPGGTPMLAVTDGVILGTQAQFPFLANNQDKAVILWAFLPPSIRDSAGRRMLSNVLIAYGHLSENAVAQRNQVVKAGDVIGISGFPPGQSDNAHLHLEVHLLSGDPALPRPSSRRLVGAFKRPQPFDNFSPFNPLLFFSERMARLHMHLGQKLGHFGAPGYPTPTMLQQGGYTYPPLDFFSIAHYQYGTQPIWNFRQPPFPSGIFDLPALLGRITRYTPFEPYPADFLPA